MCAECVSWPFPFFVCKKSFSIALHSCDNKWAPHHHPFHCVILHYLRWVLVFFWLASPTIVALLLRLPPILGLLRPTSYLVISFEPKRGGHGGRCRIEGDGRVLVMKNVSPFGVAWCRIFLTALAYLSSLSGTTNWNHGREKDLSQAPCKRHFPALAVFLSKNSSARRFEASHMFEIPISRGLDTLRLFIPSNTPDSELHILPAATTSSKFGAVVQGTSFKFGAVVQSTQADFNHYTAVITFVCYKILIWSKKIRIFENITFQILCWKSYIFLSTRIEKFRVPVQ